VCIWPVLDRRVCGMLNTTRQYTVYTDGIRMVLKGLRTVADRGACLVGAGWVGSEGES